MHVVTVYDRETKAEEPVLITEDYDQADMLEDALDNSSQSNIMGMRYDMEVGEICLRKLEGWGLGEVVDQFKPLSKNDLIHVDVGGISPVEAIVEHVVPEYNTVLYRISGTSEFETALTRNVRRLG